MFTFPVAHFGAPSKFITVRLTASENDVNIFEKADAVGSPFRNVLGGEVYVILSDGVVIGSTSTATAGMFSGAGWGTGWTVFVIVEGTDSARVQGKGGAGGQGFTSQVTNAGGGGGGGAGTQVGPGGPGDFIAGSADGQPGTATAGGSGGGGGGVGLSDNAASVGLPGGPALQATDGGPDIHLAPEASATLEVWGGGGGGGGGGIGGTGGAGGGPGLDGSAGTGTSAAAGGVNGLAYSEPGSASIVEDGPGTIDARGV